ncbi:hypothetical protein [Chryseobacterium sp. KMC2]|uniref:hypothetical protein n=1 Tax=Chryseobacterium sp. KMC2 TaxID=2800705 RepID=UPI0019239DCB|nr:hypothetical protein [Chryseobacterium sp. KMC2]MBL3548845.1 hypothetical protein [Chryseobacterium sp. KMC2]
MKKIMITGILSVFTSINIFGQVGINTTQPHPSAALEVAGDHKGFLLPRVTLTATTDNTTIAAPATGLLVYNTATSGTVPDDVVPGQYYYNGSQWIRLSDAASGWNVTGNFGTTAGINFIVPQTIRM